MTIEEKNLAVWSADATAIAIVPAARFKVPGNWQSLSRPYVIQYPIAERSTFTHSEGIQKLRIWDIFQFSIVADSFSSAKSVAEKMRTVFAGNSGGVHYFYLGQRWIGEEDTEAVGMLAVEYRIAETLTS